MKFQKVSLDESLFDENLDWADMPENTNTKVLTLTDYDDEFVGSDLPEDILEGPASGSDSGIADMLITATKSEWETIQSYNSMIETLKYEASNNPEYNTFITILKDIVAEENKHVGQIQEVLSKISPNAQCIDMGRIEGKSQFNFANGQLQVQAWEPKVQNQVNALDTVCGEDACTLTNIDDDM